MIANWPERGVDHVGPNGSPNQYHARNTKIQAIMVHHVYGSISATMVPTPALFSYRCANPTINARCGSSGLMTLGGESLTRQAASTTSGSIPSFLNSGTK